MKTKIWGCILGAVMFASALQSCQTQVEIPDGAIYPILFGSTETRAVADLVALKTNGFKVYAYFKGNQGSSSFEKNVIYSTTQNVWGFQTPEYWIPGTTYNFKAFYPKSLSGLNVDNSDATQSFTISDFNIGTQTDIMVASPDAHVVPEGKTAPDAGSVVNLTFQHLLANVVIKIEAEISVTIKDVTLKYVPVQCNYKNSSWTASSQGNIAQENLGIVLQSGAAPAEIGFLVFPQTVNGVKLSIRTSDKNYDDIPIPAIVWNPGVKYTYTLTIKQNDILFDEPTVEEWDEESAVGSVVIK